MSAVDPPQGKNFALLCAWSVFTKLLTDPDGIYRFSATQTAWIFSAGLATFALVMVLAGRWQARSGPRLMSVLGGLLLGLGFVLGGLFGSTFWTQFLFIGVVAGAGIGRKAAIVAISALQGLILLALYHGFISFGLSLGLIAGVACLLGALIMLLTNPPKRSG